MELRGWDYTGRNIGPDLHRQFRLMIYYLSLNEFTKSRKWGNELQSDLAPKMKMSSPGAVRTVKRICENLGLINRDCFSSKMSISKDKLLTERGVLIYNAAVLENQVNEDISIPDETKIKVEKEIKTLYEEAYCDALMNSYIINPDGTFFCPLRATLRALKKYDKMDKWEWYMLNTFVRHDDVENEENMLEDNILKYRDGQYNFTMKDVVEKPKGHQYIPQHYEFAGLLHVIQRPKWLIVDSNRHADIKDLVLKDDFLEKLYSGGIKGE